MITEWYNSNSSRNFPLADDVLPSLSTAALVDADIHPLNSVGRVYISRISRTEDIIEISDDTGVIASGAIATVTRLSDSRGVGVGVIVLVPELLPDEITMTVGQGELAASCVFPRNTGHVVGLILPDGSIVGGDVVIAAGPGVAVTTTAGSIKIDAVGIHDDAGACAILNRPVTCIVFRTAPGSSIIATPETKGVSLKLHGINQYDLCRPKALPAVDGSLPPAIDFCDPDPETPAVPAPATGTTSECFSGNVVINSDGSLEITPLGEDPAPTLPLNLPDRGAQGLRLALRGES